MMKINQGISNAPPNYSHSNKKKMKVVKILLRGKIKIRGKILTKRMSAHQYFQKVIDFYI